MLDYDTLIIGLQKAEEMGMKYLEAFSNSKLIANQVKEEYKVGNEDLVPCYQVTVAWAKMSKGFFTSIMSHVRTTCM